MDEDKLEKRRAYQRAYYSSPKGRESLRKRVARYRAKPREIVSDVGNVYSFPKGRLDALHTYKLDAKDFVALLESHDNKCHLCGKDFDFDRPRTICVDHCHDTGRVRGVLCPYCNKSLGWAQNITLEKITAYLG